MTNDAPLTITWEHGGRREQVVWIDDVDQWTAAELRQVDALSGGNVAGLSVAAMRGLMLAVSVARHFGLRVATVDAQLTLGTINRVREEMQAQIDERDAAAALEQAEAEAAAAAAVTEPAAEPAAAPPDGGGRDVHFTGIGYVATVGRDSEPAPDGGEDVLSPTKPGSDDEQ